MLINVTPEFVEWMMGGMNPAVALRMLCLCCCVAIFCFLRRGKGTSGVVVGGVWWCLVLSIDRCELFK